MLNKIWFFLLFYLSAINMAFSNFTFLETSLEEDIKRAHHVSGWRQKVWSDEEKIYLEERTLFIYEAHEFPLTVCINKQKIPLRMAKQHKHAIRLWNITYRERKLELWDQGLLSEHEFKQQTPNSSYGLFKVLSCQDQSSLKKTHIFASYWYMKKTKKREHLGVQMHDKTFNCDWWDYFMGIPGVPWTCLAFKRELRKLIGLNLSRVKTDDYTYVDWKHIDPRSSHVKISRTHFAYKNIAHELGHALGIPHVNSTIMEHSDSCWNTKSGVCQIADSLIDFFIGYYVNDLEIRIEQRETEQLRLIRRKRLELRRRAQRRREYQRQRLELRETRRQEQLLSRIHNVSLTEIENGIKELEIFIELKFQEKYQLQNDYPKTGNSFYNHRLRSVEDQIARAQRNLNDLKNAHLNKILGLPNL